MSYSLRRPGLAFLLLLAAFGLSAPPPVLASLPASVQGQPLPPGKRLEVLAILAAPYWRLLAALLATPEPTLRGNPELASAILKAG